MPRSLIWDSMYVLSTLRWGIGDIAPCALSFRRNTAEARRCPAPPLEGYTSSRGSAG
ncbi:hypothetical protein ALC56_09840 [Trachymyrmex septentrionalis]|uniref:Uncharacterized protein n=1 Tax=Trachymyrmex septentrionalis TaxID=34720 RepID=A0A151JUW1_9HYME|nr:hypothetical protein ALC56_09840 [Trachymyrmex septentrionalis]